MTPQDLIAQHGSIAAAAKAVGANYHTFYAWHRKGTIPAKAQAKFAATPTGSPAPSTEDAAGVAATGEQA